MLQGNGFGLSLLFAAQSDALVLILSLGFSYFAKVFFSIEAQGGCVMYFTSQSSSLTLYSFLLYGSVSVSPWLSLLHLMFVTTFAGSE